MIVICPACNRKYKLESESVTDGSKVRCKACGNVWYVYKPKEDKPMEGVIPLENDSHKKPYKCRFSVFAKLFLILIFITGCLLFAYVIFEENCPFCICADAPKKPSSLNLTKHNDLTANNSQNLNIPNKEISISDVTMRKDENSGGIIVQGYIHNTSGSAKTIPKTNVNLSSKSPEGERVSLVHKLGQDNLMPGEKIMFETDPINIQGDPKDFNCDIQFVEGE